MNQDGVEVYKMGAWSPGPGCHGGCGVKIYVKDGKFLKIEGDEDHPFLGGRLCPRALALGQYINHPDRLRYPLKRVGERGEGKWQRISWDEAYDTCEHRLRELRDRYGAESVVFGQGTGRDSGGPIIFLAYAYGSPNWTLFGLSGIACFTPRLAAMHQVAGDITFPDAGQFFPQRYNDPECVAPKVMISWARNLAGSQCTDHYFTGHWVVDMMKRGTKLIVIDPVNSWEASRAKLWLQIRPGTDGAMALGLLNVIINEDLYDKEFVEKWTYGFDKLKEQSPGIPAGRGRADHLGAEGEDHQGGPHVRQRQAGGDPLRPAAGQQRGGGRHDSGPGLPMVDHRQPRCARRQRHFSPTVLGVTIYPYSTEEVIQLYGQEFVDKMNQKRIGTDRYPLVKNFRSWALSDMVLEQMETGKPYPIKGLWCQTNNFIADTAQDPRRHYEAVRKLEFNVVVDTFMTPTAQAIADIVLPAATFPEKDSVFTTGVPCNAIYKVLTVDECKHDWEINFELAKRSESRQPCRGRMSASCLPSESGAHRPYLRAALREVLGAGA